jgi:hypothetical protein
MKKRERPSSSGETTVGQARDTGMALVLILLILSLRTGGQRYVVGALIVQVVNMSLPSIFKPAAVVWLSFSHLLGAVMSRIILSAVFFAVVAPIGLARRALGIDSLQLRQFKKGRGSVMLERNHSFTGADIEHPY